MAYFKRILILPVGSYEYHGKHLPATMDAIIATRVTVSLAERVRPTFDGIVIELPVLNYGVSLEHIGLPSTAYVFHTTYYTFVSELLDSIASDGDLLVVINGHGGNINTLSAIEADFNYRHQRSKMFFPQVYSNLVKQMSDQFFGEFDAHAGSVEASLLAFYQGHPPSEYNVELPKTVRGTFRFLRTVEMSPHAIIKQLPTVIADPARGERLHNAIADDAAESVIRLASELGDFLTE